MNSQLLLNNSTAANSAIDFDWDDISDDESFLSEGDEELTKADAIDYTGSSRKVQEELSKVSFEGTKFNSLEELHEKAQELGNQFNCLIITFKIAIITDRAVESKRKASEQQQATVVRPQARLQRLRSLTNEPQSQHEMTGLDDELKALFEKHADNRQIESVLLSPVVYSTKSRPKNTTREKIGLVRELKNFALRQTRKRQR
ncbi:hypothetical protein EDC96DRAFT_576553 [Choanephora cucurbitarum]|nr:hypothetical protein EDC96DRAFT_576553 [Choanephora cucurbitarum]